MPRGLVQRSGWGLACGVVTCRCSQASLSSSCFCNGIRALGAGLWASRVPGTHCAGTVCSPARQRRWHRQLCGHSGGGGPGSLLRPSVAPRQAQVSPSKENVTLPRDKDKPWQVGILREMGSFYHPRAIPDRAGMGPLKGKPQAPLCFRDLACVRGHPSTSQFTSE